MSEAAGGVIVAEDTAVSDGQSEIRRQAALLKTGALQNAILTSANFSIIATDENGIIQLFNVGAERMLGYTAAEVVNKLNPSDIHDPRKSARARGAERRARDPDHARLRGAGLQGLARHRGHLRAHLHLQGRQPLPAIVSISGAARTTTAAIIGYLLIGHRQLGEGSASRLELNKAMGRRRQCQPGEVGLPLEHEPRAAHAALAILGFAQLMESDRPSPDKPPRAQHRPDPQGRLVPARSDQRGPRPRG
jgi:PAS domain S-box-containing protein